MWQGHILDCKDFLAKTTRKSGLWWEKLNFKIISRIIWKS